MNKLIIQGTQSSPSVVADWEQGLLDMRGDSYPENSFDFFGQIIGWIERYLKESAAPLRLDLRLVYMNTSSVKALMDIFDMLEEAHGDGREVCVHWYYDSRNERVVDLADEFREDCSFPFEIGVDER